MVPEAVPPLATACTPPFERVADMAVPLWASDCPEAEDALASNPDIAVVAEQTELDKIALRMFGVRTVMPTSAALGGGGGGHGAVHVCTQGRSWGMCVRDYVGAGLCVRRCHTRVDLKCGLALAGCRTCARRSGTAVRWTSPTGC